VAAPDSGIPTRSFDISEQHGDRVGEALDPVVALRHLARGKSLTRAGLAQLIATRVFVTGDVLDLGGGASASYRAYLPGSNYRLTSVDISEQGSPDVLLDLETSPLPFAARSFDTILAFNLLEHIYNHDHVLEEAARVLRHDGTFYLWVPFLIGYHPDPEDYFRYTRSCLERKLRAAGFRDPQIASVGGRFTTAANLALPGLRLRVVEAFVAVGALLLDRLYYEFARTTTRDQFALGYLATCRGS
jgi:SAM-dependent methyltransferase